MKFALLDEVVITGWSCYIFLGFHVNPQFLCFRVLYTSSDSIVDPDVRWISHVLICMDQLGLHREAKVKLVDLSQ